jgi:hypothetical protein
VDDEMRCRLCQAPCLFLDDGLCSRCASDADMAAADDFDRWADYTPDPEPPLAVTVRVSVEGR